MNINDALQELNKSQLEAVKHNGGPLFVVAGAGTGKTKTLTTRIAYLIDKENVDPNSILAVTFTNKAAKEIRDRINALIYPNNMGSWLYTFHAFGLRILKSHADKLNLGYSNNFSVIDEDDARKIVKEVLKDMDLDNVYNARQIRNLISSYKTNMTTSFDETDYYDILDNYQDYLRNEQLMDFDDLLVYTRKLFNQNEELLNFYQNQFEHILIDEFQDTDIIQYDIIKLLSQKHNNTFVVGDPDQSIYSFRGSRYANNELFIKDFNARVVILDQNYRSTNNILKVANQFIKNNDQKSTEKALVSNLGEGDPVVFKRLETDYDEADFVGNEIKRLVRNGYKYDDIAILYRNNSLSRLFEHEFMQTNIPYIIYGGLSFYDRREVKDIIAYLRVIMNPHLNFYLKRIINVPSRKIGRVTLNKLETYALKHNLSIFEAIPQINLGGAAGKALNNFYDLIIELQDEFNKLEKIEEIIDIISDKSGYHKMLVSSGEEIDQDRIANIRELRTVLLTGSWQYENALNNHFIVQYILDDISLLTDQDKDVDSLDSVKLATIHQVKGLEFKVVFLVVLEEGIFPSQRAFESKDAIEEERRVAYVGLTRAKEKLYISNARRRLVYGSRQFLEESSFIKEMIGNTTSSSAPRRVGLSQPQITITDNSFKAGDKITHDIFGLGVVISIEGDIATIAFSAEHGVKKLMKGHPAITKIN